MTDMVKLTVEELTVERSFTAPAANVTGAITVGGETAGGVTVLLKDADGMAMIAMGATVPSDTTAGYAKGCLFIDSDATTVATVLFVNVGTDASCDFDAAIGAS